jgi:hypothetical protein
MGKRKMTIIVRHQGFLDQGKMGVFKGLHHKVRKK